MIRVVPYVLYLLALAFFRTNLAGLVSIGPAQVDFAALLVLLVALNKREVETLWFAFAAGLVYDAPDPSRLGVQMLILTLLAALMLQVKERFNLESVGSRMVLIVAGLLIYSVPYTMVYATSGFSDFFRVMLVVAIPSTVYTAVFGWLFFMLQSGRLTYAKIKSIF